MVALAVRRAAVIIFALVIIAVALTVFANHRAEGGISSFHFHGNISINNTPAPAIKEPLKFGLLLYYNVIEL